MNETTLVLLACGGLMAAACSAARDTDTVHQEAASPPTSAACNVEELQTAATELASARAAWSPSSGHAPSQSKRAAEALTKACSEAFLSPHRQVLDTLTQADRTMAFPVYDNTRARTERACADLENVAAASVRVEAAERAAVLFDGCDLGRFSSVVSREEFIAAGANTGAIALLALDLDLRDASVPTDTADTLTRALVLDSGPRLWVPEALRLPAADTGQPLPRDRSTMILTRDAFGVRPSSSEELQAFDADGVFDALSGARDTDQEMQAAAKGAPTPWVLAVDREVPYARVQAVFTAFEKAGIAPPRLLVLVESSADPYRLVEAPAFSPERASQSVDDVLAASR